jgi:hypothetical protein
MAQFRFGDRVRVPDGRAGDVIGFYRTSTEMALVQFDDGESRKIALSMLKRATTDEQTLLQEITERVQDSSDGFHVVMPVSQWIDAHMWPAPERAAVVWGVR